MPSHRARRLRPQLEMLDNRLVLAIKVTTLRDVVANDGLTSLREAITTANATAVKDVIQLDAGTYKIASVDGMANDNANGDFDVTNPVIIKGKGANVTFIDANKLGRIFDVIGTFDVQFEKLTLRNGGGLVNGGAIQALTANLTLNQCVVRDNQGLTGGGINAEHGDVTLVDTKVIRNQATDPAGVGGGVRAATGVVQLTNSTVAKNAAAFAGGGVAAARAIVVGSTISGNSAFAGGGITATAAFFTDSTVRNNVAKSVGGGIAADDAELTRCTVSGNRAATDGGGINAKVASLIDTKLTGNVTETNGGGGIQATTTILFSCTVSDNRAGSVGGSIDAEAATLTNCTISGNRAAENGGAISAGKATLTNCTVSGNTAAIGVGGGIDATTVELTNCTVSGNSALLAGGGINTQGGDLLNCTIVRNVAENAGGLNHGGTSALNVKNTIVAQNRVTHLLGHPDVSGVFVSVGNNLIGIAKAGNGFADHVLNDHVGSADKPLDPRLGPLANNGGPTQTHALQANSPAIDAGNNNGAPTSDQRGLKRIKDGNRDGAAIADIGAFEK